MFRRLPDDLEALLRRDGLGRVVGRDFFAALGQGLSPAVKIRTGAEGKTAATTPMTTPNGRAGGGTAMTTTTESGGKEGSDHDGGGGRRGAGKKAGARRGELSRVPAGPRAGGGGNSAEGERKPYMEVAGKACSKTGVMR